MVDVCLESEDRKRKMNDYIKNNQKLLHFVREIFVIKQQFGPTILYSLWSGQETKSKDTIKVFCI